MTGELDIVHPRYGWGPSQDVAHVAWLSPYDYPVAIDRGGDRWLGSRYSHAVRILHPAYDRGYRPIGWQAIARGAAVTVDTSFADLIGTEDPNALLPGIFDWRPVQGTLPDEIVPTLQPCFYPMARSV